MMRGKLEPERLKNFVLPHLGALNPKVCVPPRLGEDAAVIDLGCTYLVLASDPITGAIDNIGMYCVNVNANDVACMGATPQFFLSVILLPEAYTDDQLERIASDISAEAKSLNVAIVGGHTEVFPFSEPIVVGTMAGTADTVVTSAGAHLGDTILLTKGAAIEGTSILATDFYDVLKEKVDASLLKRAQKYLTHISIVKEALLSRTYATAMHDPTEGGIAGALHELADASHVGFSVDVDKIPVSQETRAICSALSVDPLRLISSGSLLITAPPDATPLLLDSLSEEGIAVAVIGEITEDRNLEPVKQDELWRILEESV
ncbi:MAG: AIR synthase family protein [Theionarchaea archaeon]|nr:AIR synthase family protein [Theionarchaea archaeon]MBU7001020.1 AIR synthase family protein [Theionarchaea archaeon]MBU7020509.1 AIR synthase family protein [Theionarchaea archaeon]MBU7034448.1 AIR synthase family protein [Theionarchaea archaeon]MBU7039803.1 AIR synthase family protein [Theionarchaea archaeon]